MRPSRVLLVVSRSPETAKRRASTAALRQKTYTLRVVVENLPFRQPQRPQPRAVAAVEPRLHPLAEALAHRVVDAHNLPVQRLQRQAVEQVVVLALARQADPPVVPDHAQRPAPVV